MRPLPVTQQHPVGKWRFLGLGDVLEPTDLVRETRYMGASDQVDHDAIKRMQWSTVSERMPYWVGKTLRSYYLGAPSALKHLELIRKL